MDVNEFKRKNAGKSITLQDADGNQSQVGLEDRSAAAIRQIKKGRYMIVYTGDMLLKNIERLRMLNSTERTVLDYLLSQLAVELGYAQVRQLDAVDVLKIDKAHVARAFAGLIKARLICPRIFGYAIDPDYALAGRELRAATLWRKAHEWYAADQARLAALKIAAYEKMKTEDAKEKADAATQKARFAAIYADELLRAAKAVIAERTKKRAVKAAKKAAKEAMKTKTVPAESPSADE
jgi:hypothetical protein